jgi:hypothetical protein
MFGLQALLLRESSAQLFERKVYSPRKAKDACDKRPAKQKATDAVTFLVGNAEEKTPGRMSDDQLTCSDHQQIIEHVRCYKQVEEMLDHGSNLPNELLSIVYEYEKIDSKTDEFVDSLVHVNECDEPSCTQYRSVVEHEWIACHLCNEYLGKFAGNRYDTSECVVCQNLICVGSGMGGGPPTGCCEFCSECQSEICSQCYMNHTTKCGLCRKDSCKGLDDIKECGECKQYYCVSHVHLCISNAPNAEKPKKKKRAPTKDKPNKKQRTG